MLGEEDMPTDISRNPIMKRESYMNKVLSYAITNVNKDKNR
tara:strand:- start:2708 stop:2830 length:123 start_codon:yes stop_codon:yes gene_type:complete